MNEQLLIIDKIKQVYDPEIPINIYDVGLIYRVIYDDGKVYITMTLTSPNCPSAQEIPEWIHDSVMELDFVTMVHISIVWEPQWHPGMMSDEAKMMLGLDDF